MEKDAPKEALEKRIGDSFIAWLNLAQGVSYVFDRRGDGQPDLLYKSDAGGLPIEVTVAYTNEDFAAVTWRTMRPSPTGRRTAVTRDPEGELIRSLSDRLVAKSQMDYPAGAVLIVYLAVPLTQLEFEGLLPRLHIPSNRLAAIYVGGTTSGPHPRGDVGDWWLRISGAD